MMACDLHLREERGVSRDEDERESLGEGGREFWETWAWEAKRAEKERRVEAQRGREKD